TVGSRAGFLWFGFGFERGVGPARMFDDDDSGFIGAVGHGVGVLGDFAGGFDHHPVVHGDVVEGAGVGETGAMDLDGLAGCLGEEAALAGMDGIEEAFGGKLAALEDGEAARTEAEIAVVFEPAGAEGLALGLAL